MSKASHICGCCATLWGTALTVTPFLDDQLHGVFATRSPRRPNSIGIPIVRLLRVGGPVLHVLDLDVIDRTPALDIKLYVPKFDVRETDRIGWYEGKVRQEHAVKSDGRFSS